MRILLCLHGDFMSNIALNRLRPILEGHDFDIVRSRSIGLKSAQKARAITEWQNFEQTLIEGQLFPLIDARGSDHWFQSFAEIAKGCLSGKLHEFPSINRDEGLEFARRFAPDLIVSIRFGQIFKPPLIQVPRFGIINLHSGILPGYRGILATFWMMLEGEREVGCTLHRIIDVGIDTGPVIGIHRKPAEPKRSLLWNVASLYEGGTAMIADAIASLTSGRELASTPQPSGAGRYFSFPDEEHARQFLARGLNLYTAEDYSELCRSYGVTLKPTPPFSFTVR